MYDVHRTSYKVPRTRYEVQGTMYIVLVRCTSYLVHSTYVHRTCIYIAEKWELRQAGGRGGRPLAAIERSERESHTLVVNCTTVPTSYMIVPRIVLSRCELSLVSSESVRVTTSHLVCQPPLQALCARAAPWTDTHTHHACTSLHGRLPPPVKAGAETGTRHVTPRPGKTRCPGITKKCARRFLQPPLRKKRGAD